MENCAKVLFYDSGYKSTKGVSKTTISEWTKKLENAYKNRSNTCPIQSQKKGSVSVIEKVEKLEPGLVQKHFRYAQKTIGNQAAFDALARTMTLKVRPTARQTPMELQSDTTSLPCTAGSSHKMARTSHRKRSPF